MQRGLIFYKTDEMTIRGSFDPIILWLPVFTNDPNKKKEGKPISHNTKYSMGYDIQFAVF